MGVRRRRRPKGGAGRSGIGVELSPRYAKVAHERLAELAGPGVVPVLQADARRIADPALWEGI